MKVDPVILKSCKTAAYVVVLICKHEHARTPSKGHKYLFCNRKYMYPAQYCNDEFSTDTEHNPMADHE